MVATKKTHKYSNKRKQEEGQLVINQIYCFISPSKHLQTATFEIILYIFFILPMQYRFMCSVWRQEEVLRERERERGTEERIVIKRSVYI